MTPQRVTLKDHVVPLEFLRDWGVAVPTRLKSRWTEVDGLRLHSRSSPARTGRRPFVLLHGLVISSLYHIPLAECLAERSETHALDLPGYGRSAKPARPLHVPALADAVARWIAEGELGACHVIGNSFGCQVAAELAVKHPEAVRTVTLIGPSVDPAAPTLFGQALRLLRDLPHEPLRLWLNHVVDYGRAGPRFAPALMRIMMEDHIEEKLPHLGAPTLVLRGEFDSIVPAAWARKVDNLLPRSQLITIPKGSHCVHYAAPESVAEAIEAFLKEFDARC